MKWVIQENSNFDRIPGSNMNFFLNTTRSMSHTVSDSWIFMQEKNRLNVIFAIMPQRVVEIYGLIKEFILAKNRINVNSVIRHLQPNTN